MAMLLEFLERHRARYLFRSSHLNFTAQKRNHRDLMCSFFLEPLA